MVSGTKCRLLAIRNAWNALLETDPPLAVMEKWAGEGEVVQNIFPPET
jgi:hypothetical protein